jgi:hypothetical protein
MPKTQKNAAPKRRGVFLWPNYLDTVPVQRRKSFGHDCAADSCPAMPRV